ncbi:MAG: VWA domain-containing protein [Chloroflexota bacterium]
MTDLPFPALPPDEPGPLADAGAGSPPGLVTGGPYRYARWDGRQRLPDLSADEILDGITDDLLAESDLTGALRRLLERGMRRPPGAMGDDLAGIDDLLERIAEERRRILEQHQLGDVLGDIREELRQIVDTERRGIDRRLAGTDGDPSLQKLAADMAQKRAERLDALPPDPGERIRALQDYDFLEPAARERFEALLSRLRDTMLDGMFQGIADAIRNATPEQLAANREMVRDLNDLLERRLAGDEPPQADVDAFLGRHGDFFPGARTLDDIVAQLGERMAAMASMLRSMTPAQRAELESLMDSLLGDDRIRADLARLAGTLDQLIPGGLGERLRFRGDEPMSLEGALAQMNRLGQLDRLADDLVAATEPEALPDVDLDRVRELLGQDSADDLEALQGLLRRLREAGYLEGDGDRLELTPRGMRRLGQGVLEQLFGHLRRDAFGGHAVHRTGRGGERAELSTPWEFGRPFDLDLQRTLGSAMARRTAGGSADTGAVHLDPEDFWVHGTEDLADAATVLLLDMSRSMLLRGCFLAAKKVAIALDTLIRTQFPRDTLHVVGFAYHAREIRPGALPGLSWHGYEYGTNLQHGLMIARALLTRSHAANRSVVVITDGEPTAHIEDGQVEFSYPPTRRTIEETLREVGRCTREGITINTFMLERSRALAAFVERMTRLNRGRAFFADPDDLGSTVLVDYVGRRRGRA